MTGHSQALRRQFDALFGAGGAGGTGQSWLERERGAELGAEVSGPSASSLPRF